MKRYYITTPIYYVNDKPHIGHALTTVAADVNARYQKMRGREVMFLTGTDENGPKIVDAAEKAGKTPQQLVDELSTEFRELWTGLGIEFDDFIRTTEPRHKAAVQEVFKRLREKGDVYEGQYEGWYCVPDETFWRPNEVEDGLCPNPECRRAVEWVTERNFFFKLSAYADRLTEYINANPGFIRPEGRRNEVLRFIESGLRDACITRANNGWGITVPGDDTRVFYVWFDALINYLTATGWPEKDGGDLWPADVQWMGKDILVRFHATLWPAMLMGLGLPLPKVLIGHGFMNFGGEKMSKTRGNVVGPAQLARELAERAGCSPEMAVDAVRYYDMREMPYASDSTFTQEAFDNRYNFDLANDLGNAIHRTVAMTHKFVDGMVPDADADPAFANAIKERVLVYEAAMEGLRLDQAIAAAFEAVSALNRYIDEMAPWSLAKKGDAVALNAVMRTMLETGRVIGTLIAPFMPAAAKHIHSQLGFAASGAWEEAGRFDLLKPGTKLPEPQAAFPRLQPPTEKPAEKPVPKEEPKVEPEYLSFEEFQKVELRIADIVSAERVAGADKLLKMTIRLGDEERPLVAGIALAYEPADLVGKQIVIVANLKPAKIRGELSQGMLLAAVKADGQPILLSPMSEAPSGAKVS
jgi:methionyl-tRNA synthetase